MKPPIRRSTKWHFSQKGAYARTFNGATEFIHRNPEHWEGWRHYRVEIRTVRKGYFTTPVVRTIEDPCHYPTARAAMMAHPDEVAA